MGWGITNPPTTKEGWHCIPNPQQLRMVAGGFVIPQLVK